MNELNIKKPSRNVMYQSQFAGGSNGGTANCIGAGILPFAIANDSEGQIRISAAYNGIIGYKPTINRWMMKDSF